VGIFVAFDPKTGGKLGGKTGGGVILRDIASPNVIERLQHKKASFLFQRGKATWR
jgi:hypothetical protein